MIRTRVGYAGGTKTNPTYRNLGDNSETIEIDYDPDIISYQELLDVFWAENAAVMLPNSRQYYSIIFYHSDEQKRLAEESYEARKASNPGTVFTEIVPFQKFWIAEDYHQKYYLQYYNILYQDVKSNYATFNDFVNSTVAARLNGYVGGYGDKAVLERDIGTYGLSADGQKRLLGITSKGLSPACGINLAPID